MDEITVFVKPWQCSEAEHAVTSRVRMLIRLTESTKHHGSTHKPKMCTQYTQGMMYIYVYPSRC